MKLRKKLVLADGATVSVQASEGHYCTPRDDAGPYAAVEVGFPSVAVPSDWDEFCDTPGDVWGYVPAERVREFIADHGGIVSGELPPLV